MDKRTISVKICMMDEDNFKNTVIVNVTVPSDVTDEQVAAIMEEEHDYLMEHLCTGTEEDNYGKNGQDGYTLISTICAKLGWEWNIWSPTLSMSLN